MSDRVDATVYAVQLSSRGAVLNSAGTEAELAHLSDCRDAVLPPGEVSKTRVERRWLDRLRQWTSDPRHAAIVVVVV